MSMTVDEAERIVVYGHSIEQLYQAALTIVDQTREIEQLTRELASTRREALEKLQRALVPNAFLAQEPQEVVVSYPWIKAWIEAELEKVKP